MVERTRVVVIGGGAVGCSCLYHLTRLGWTDAVLVERSELTSGSTWHAAGNCPTFSTGWGLLKLQQYSAALYRRLGTEVDYPINYHVTGSVRLAHSAERIDEYRHVIGMAHANGLAYELFSPEQLRERYPFVELDGLQGALWDPEDGDIDPAQLTQALAAGARRAGGRIFRFTHVTGLAQRPTGEWLVETDKGNFLTDVVVNAAGYRAGEVMSLLGQSLPTVAMSHQYLVTDDIPELAALAGKLPLLRDPDDSYYLRQERTGLILGPYERSASAQWLNGIPDDFAYKLWPDDLERLESHIDRACRRVPLLGTAGIKRVVNGPIPYSPDGLPYLGPAHGLRNFYHCNTFSFGIAQAGGAGKALAEWVVNGGPEWDLWSIDPRRFTAYATRTYTLAKAIETYQNEYAPAFPYEERSAGRPVRTSPLHHALRARGAVFGNRAGWERALWYDESGTTAQTLTFRRNRSWMQVVGGEVRAARSRVALMDLPGFSKFLIEGPGAVAFLDSLLCSRLPRPGRVSLAYALDRQGKIRSELTLTRLADDRFYAVSAASAEYHDEDLLAGQFPRDGSVTVTNLTSAYGTLVIAGPHAREVLAKITDADLSNEEFPWLSGRRMEIGTATVLALRINYVGELGWELHTPVEHMPALYDSLVTAGRDHELAHVGLYAIDSLRIEKGYPGWKSDLDTSVSPLEASLDRFVDTGKGDFVGRDALLRQRHAGIDKRLVVMTLDDPGPADAQPFSVVFRDTERVGLVTSGSWAFTLGQSVALAYVRADLAAEGTRLQIDILGERRAATVRRAPLFDPDNSRLRSL